MPDSFTKWSYRPVSPWYTVESRLHIAARGEVVLRAQANAAHGAKINQLFYDRIISPRLGLRAGLLDYRATWCRSFDLDNPWVSETDPFCANKQVRLPTDSAPAIQAYVNQTMGQYLVEAVVGSYHPLAFNYEKEEFSDFVLPPTANVTHNHKILASVNALETFTATEWRLSWIGTRQSLFDPSAPIGPTRIPINYHHKASLWFLGVSWNVSPKLRSRVTHMTSSLTGTCEFLRQTSIHPCIQKFQKKSSVVELNYNFDSRNVYSLAFSYYPRKQTNVVPDQGNVFRLLHQSFSIGWRKDWTANVFTSLQLMYSQYDSLDRRSRRATAEVEPQTGHATGLGFRVGYRF